MWKKIGILIFWCILAGYLFVAVSFSSRKDEEIVCKNISIVLVDSTLNKYINADDIYPLISNVRNRLIGQALHDINTRELEQTIKRYPPVAGAESFTTPDGTLHVEVRQRVPVLRIINRFNESFYLDSEGKILIPVPNYTSHVPVANGFIDQRLPAEGAQKVARTDQATPKGQRIVLNELFQLASFLRKHPFWDAQIQQIYVRENLDYEMIPRIGNHTILFGSINDYQSKFEHLEALYKKALNVKGWDTYETINLTYKNQIVCTRRDSIKN